MEIKCFGKFVSCLRGRFWDGVEGLVGRGGIIEFIFIGYGWFGRFISYSFGIDVLVVKVVFVYVFIIFWNLFV